MDQCPAGYYCEVNTTTPTNYPCPVGYYCPAGTEYDTQYACPPGTYNNMTQVSQQYYTEIIESVTVVHRDHSERYSSTQRS